jgi:N utilization substance protein A
MDVAIGPNGRTVKRLQDRIGKSVELVEDADSPETFVANALAPAAVYGVEVVEEKDEVIAVADVDEADKGAAIGSNGRNVAGARLLANRHFGVTEIRIE